MNKFTVIVWDRSKWYETLPLNPHMYYFLKEDQTVMWDDLELPPKFLKIPTTAIYEFGGTHEEALKALETAGFTHVIVTDNVA